ncbi:MAG: rubrerythrin family protein [Actinobacteria bacterium]|nr:rubrerythrin family protein [Actinomycetota bacterium]MCG2795328.1 rubrerythrin family protein [Actinomycetes bacterium]MBU4241016.1 rubrerythrin family protein [Actinomycetota bacterium]MBU4302409.1 rubrerythrin family protein [Actinomycetota bacterium]MBU4385451.1 rubrerythrin family protein [Actinomycetota bacterium]
MADNETGKDLHAAYEGESKASVRLKVYAEKADKEDYPGVARLFRAIAESEAIHARNNLRLIGEVKDTETNLSESFAHETKIAQVSYGGFIAQAEREGNDKAARMFTWARDVEEVHANLYEKALEHMLAEEEPTYFICEVCGYVADGSVPDVCPVCGSPAKVFFESS